ncbi:MAG: hypothetical protein IT328_00260 [Caldilineaceae bacterium]|nr:hypothetical protein [Caldilineaceae bacterium]
MLADIADDGLLAEAAALAGAFVAIVQHSGRRGTHEEFETLVRGLEDAGVEYPENVYVQALLTPATRQQIADFAQEFEEAPAQSIFNDFKMAALNRCAQAAEWLAAHATPEAAAEVKASIVAVCRLVAAASKEEGAMNNAPGNVDDFEVSAIDQVSRALGIG